MKTLQAMFFWGCGLLSTNATAEWFNDQQAIMGTEVKVTLWHTDPVRGRAAVQAVMDEMRRIDATLSPYIETSDLAQVNAKAAHQTVPLTNELTLLIDKSLYFSHISHGAFDITFASVGWYYDYRKHQKPSEAQTEALLPAVNYRLLQFDKARKTLHFGHPDLRIDLGGIAKGYSVDRAVAIMRQYGVDHATVSAGGDSRLLGDKLGRPWLIGIKNPRLKGDEKSEVVITMPLSDLAVSTSGDYERYFIDEQTGERVHHIINPKTGKSAEEVMSVTILGPQGVDTDALSTTVFVLGVKEGVALINTLTDFDCVIIDRHGQVFYSEGLMPPAAGEEDEFATESASKMSKDDKTRDSKLSANGQ